MMFNLTHALSRGAMCAPLKSKNKTIGIFNLSSNEPHNYLAEDLKVFVSIASQTATALTNAQLFEQLHTYSEELENKNIQLQKEIIQREQSEKALRASEEKYRLHFENVLDVIYSVDADLKIISISPSVEQIVGYAPEELIGRAFPDLNLLTEDSLKRALADTMRIMGGESIDSAEYNFIAKDGSIKTGEVSSAPLFENGKIVSIFSVARDITERIQSRQALLKSENRFRTMAENITNGLIIMEDGEIVYVNDRASQICGYPKEELIEKWGPDLVIPEEVERKEKIIREAHNTGKYPEDFDIWIQRKDGSKRCVSLRFSFRSLDTTRYTGYVVMTDITERKITEEKQKEMAAFLDNIIENSLDFILIADNKGYITRVNKFFVEAIGYEIEEILGKHSSQFAPTSIGSYELLSGDEVSLTEEFFDDQLNMIAQLRKEKKVSNWDSFFCRKDGKLIPIDQNIVYLFDQRGEVIAAVGMSRDITERKKAEKEITETRDFLQDVITTSLDGIIVTDTRSTITMVNESAVNIFGYSQEELLGHRTREFLEGGGEIQKKGKQIQKILMEKEAVYGYEHKWKKKDGTFVDVEMSIALLKDHNKDLAGSVLSIRDITERKQAEKKILDYQNQLRSLASQLTLTEEQERRRIATDLHDRIGQTLAISKIRLGALRASTTSLGLDKDVDEIRDLVEQSIQDTRSLIFDLCPPFLYELGFEKALEWLLDDIQEQYGITTHFECDGKPYQLDDDLRILLYQSVRELFINIVKHAQAQHARLSLQTDPTSLNLCVEDDGRGFNEPTSAFRFDKEGGFGLFRIQERFHYLGGEINIDSKPHQGTRISLVLPFKSSEHTYKEDVK
jgi:PAS domain S-box-containing protein